MNYTLHQLQVFLKVFEKQSVTKASEELYLTQPAVSIQLKKLQEQFDIPLMEVIGRKVYITDFGKQLAVSCQKILDEIQVMNNNALAHKGLLAGKLKISVVSTGKYVMPYFLSGFSKEYPGVNLTIDVTNKSSVVSSLERNEVDFALVSVLPDNLQVNRIELMKNKLYLIGKNSGDQGDVSMHLKSLSKIPLIFREKGSATRQAMEDYMLSNKIEKRSFIELTSNEAVKQAVLSGLGYSIMPLIGIKNELLIKDLSIVKVKGLPIITNWNLIWLKGKELSPIARSYLDYVNTYKSLITKTSFEWYENY